MSATDRLDATSVKWRGLEDRAQRLTTAGFIGRIIGRSYSADAISMETLADFFAEEVERCANDEARERALSEINKQTEADE
jgi:hypothetical protein